MTGTLPVVYGVLASLCWGLAPVLSKRGFRTGGYPSLAALVFVLIGLVTLWTGSLLQYSSTHIGRVLTVEAVLPFLLAGTVGTGIGRLLNYTGIKRLGASVNSAIVATDPMFAAALAFLFLGESVAPVQVLAVVSISSGVAVLVLSGSGNRKGWARHLVAIPLGSALAYGAGAVVRRFGLTTTDVPPLLGAALNETAAVIPIAAYAVCFTDVRTHEAVTPVSYTYLIAAGVANTAGLFFLFASLDTGPVVIGSTLAGTSTLVTLGASVLVLRETEQVTRRTVLGVLFVVTGAVLITLL